MHYVYAGRAGTAHSAAWLGFLAELGTTSVVAIEELGSVALDGAGMLVIDGAWDAALPESLNVERLPLPTVLVGTYGVRLAEQLNLKFGSNYGCMCLKEDAIVWDATHPVFDGVTDSIEAKAPPANFRAFSAILDVPATVPALRVLRDAIDTPGQVTVGFDFLDSPDCEILAGGFNEKTSAHFAIARQSRFLHWGFAGSPEQYTDQGRALLVNCLRYLVRFAADPLREGRTSDPRSILQLMLSMEGWRGVGLPAEMRVPMMQRFLQSLFAMPVPPAAFGERPERLAWFEANRPFLHNDGQGWLIDVDAQALGLAIDDPALLEACLNAPADRRSQQLWLRYTGRQLDDPQRERAWLDRHREPLYFTEWGGYRWVSRLEPAQPRPRPAAPVIAAAQATLGAARYGDRLRGMILLDIPPGFHAYAPDSDEGLPLSLQGDAGFEVLEPLQIEAKEGRLSGQAGLMFSARGDGTELRLRLRLQLCDSLSCQMPQTLELRCPITETA
ncbi:MAG TPA: hypothetical protein VJN44_05495 [Roseateles sp.]|nr:hypothetical protein [Roseateles sp.]